MEQEEGGKGTKKEPNKEIKQFPGGGKDANIGVGSVVLNVRKQRKIDSHENTIASDDEEGAASPNNENRKTGGYLVNGTSVSSSMHAHI